ncbi:MAG TPA: PAS domain S-box protein [Candidatus Aquilonibacter sp.]|nr:PAS domain S-box protein [Candidatus Aquilonibacter sp.]
MALDGVPPASLDQILCTEQLNLRPLRPPDHQRENCALVSLMQALADSPETILQALADAILETLRCGSAGVSLLTTHDGGKRFYWPAIAGVWKRHIGGGTPRDFGPCGTVLDHNKTLLFKHVERVYTYFEPVKPLVEEALLAPFHVRGQAVGTVWAVAHDESRKFDSEDKRQLESLARFASAAYQTADFFDSKARLAAIVESSDDAIVSKNLNGIILSWNSGAERIFGYSAAEAVGQPITLIIPRELQQEEREILERLRNGERLDHFETVRFRKDGRRVNVSLTISPVRDSQGRIIGASKIARDISERSRFEEALKESEFSARLLKVQDEDRRSIARELHDGVGQLLAAISMNIGVVAEEKNKLSPDAARRVEENKVLLHQASTDIRTVSYLLHPPLLDEMGLRSALQWYIEGFSERSKIATRLEVPADLVRLPRDYELVIFRVAQECLTNIHRHAKSSSAIVRLSNADGKLTMQIKDNGEGIDPEIQTRIASGKTSGVGLRGMRERLAAIGGALRIESNVNGTSVFVSLPLEKAAEAAQGT